MKYYYFDYNATHPPFKEILLEATESYTNQFFNPSGPTRFSLNRQSIIESARNYFASLVNKNKEQIVFTSTGTESNFLLISSLYSYLKKFDRILISPFEHSSLYGTLDYFKIPYEILSTDKSGIIDLNNLREKLKISPSPLILIYAANETGVIQPIQECSEILKEFSMQLFSDLMQAFAKIPIEFSLLNGFSFSGHKIGAGMGAALTYVDKEFAEKEYGFFKGGNQENGHRAGTENTSAIESFKKAAQIQLENLEEKNKRLLYFRNKIESTLKELGSEIIAETSNRLVSTSFALIPLEEIDFLMMGLEEKGILISNGSSCKSRSREASTSLLKMGYSKEEALKAIRISTGYFTTLDEVEFLCEEIKNVFFKLNL